MRIAPCCLRVTALRALLCAALAAGPLLAQPKPGEEEFKLGMQLLRNRDFEKAIAPLEAASRAAPRPSALTGLGYCYRQLKRFPEAIRAYQRYLEAGFEEEARVGLLLEQTMEEEREWRKLHPVVQEPAAEPPIAPAPASAAQPPVAPASTTQPQVAPAPSALGAGAQTPAPAVQPSAAPAVAVLPSPSVAGAAVEPARPRVWTWVAGGAAVASLGAGLALGLMSISTANEIESTEHPGAEVASLRDKVKWQAQKGNLFVGIGAGLALVSAGLFVLHF